MFLDAANNNSYPGTGNSWTDLSGYGTVATRTGGLPFTTVNNVECFDFDGSNYFYAPETNVPMEDAFTLSMWYYHEGVAERDTIFEKDGDTYQSYQQEIACTIETDHDFSYYWGRTPAYDNHRTPPLTTSSWQQVLITRAHGDVTDPKTTTAFINNEVVVLNPNNYNSADAITPTTDEVRIGYGYGGAMESGYISVVKVYDKVLSESERDQNYDALGYRFGKATNSMTTDTIPLNTYSHIVAKKEGTNCSIYINGQLSKSFNCNISQDLTGNLQIGHRASGVNEYFNGTIDEVRISNTARSTSWINASYKTMNNQFITYNNEENVSDGWDTTQNATNDLNSWNFNITVVDNGGMEAWKIDEYGVYKYTFIEPSQNWVGVIALPGENDTSDVVAVTYSSNYDFNMTLWFEENLANQTRGTTILIANNVDILNDTDPNDDIDTGDITFNGIEEANAVDIFDTSGIFPKNNVSQTVDVQFNVRIPIGTMWGEYIAHIGVKINQKT